MIKNKQYKNIFKKELEESEKNSIFKNIVTEIKSYYKSEEIYTDIDDPSFHLINKDWEISLKNPNSKQIRQLIKELVKEIITNKEELLFSLLDQGNQRYGNYGYWEYKEKWNKKSLKYIPVNQFNNNGDIAYNDGNPFLGYHLNKGKYISNIWNKSITIQNIKKAKNKLIKQLEDYKEKEIEFYLLIPSEFEFSLIHGNKSNFRINKILIY